MNHEKILLFVPCYNCAPQIGRVVSQISGPILDYIAEILILDNGSCDGTVDAAIDSLKYFSGIPVKIARNHHNYNLGGSHKAAFFYAEACNFTHVIVLHGDDQGHIEDMLEPLSRGLHRTYDVVLGARFMHGSRLTGYSRFRISGNHIINVLLSILTFRRIYDLGSGLNIFNKRAFSNPIIQRFSDDLRFNIYFLLYLFSSSCSSIFVPISWREDDQISNVKIFSQTMRTLQIVLGYTFRRSLFLLTDHRDIAYANYEFDVLFEKPGGLL